jgi:membrane-associated phospholipid phosphatase
VWRSKAIRATAWAVVVAGVLAPLARKRVKAPAVAMQALAYAAPVGLCVAARRSRTRDVAMCVLQMWAYVAAYETPHDDAERQRERVHLRYPIVIDRALGLGELPTVRLQRALARVGPQGPEWRAVDGALVWAHWIWFLVPHTALAYILLRRPQRFPRAAAMTYGVFNIGACFYWVLPTAPPWYAASFGAGTIPPIAGAAPALTDAPDVRAAAPTNGSLQRVRAEMSEALLVRRMMVEYGEHFWKEGWGPLFNALGGNPLAAMPSLHVATSAMAALLLSEVGPLEGGLGWSYAIALSFSLVYLGEHYVVDLLGGLALTGAVYRLGPRAAPVLEGAARSIAALEERAHACV